VGVVYFHLTELKVILLSYPYLLRDPKVGSLRILKSLQNELKACENTVIDGIEDGKSNKRKLNSFHQHPINLSLSHLH